MYMRNLSLPFHTAWNCRSQRWADGRESLCRQSAGHQEWICSRTRLRDPGPQSGWETHNQLRNNLSTRKANSTQRTFLTIPMLYNILEWFSSKLILIKIRSLLISEYILMLLIELFVRLCTVACPVCSSCYIIAVFTCSDRADCQCTMLK